jgi:hypothetical protein
LDIQQRQCGTYNISYVDNNNVTQEAPTKYCNYTLAVTPYSSPAIIGSGDQVPVMLMVNSTFTGFSKPTRKAYFDNGLYAHITSFSIINGTWEQVPSTGIYGEVGYQPGYNNLVGANATECGLDVCVHKYRGSVTNSTFKEELLGTFINTTDFGYNHEQADDLWTHPPQSWTNHTEDKGANLFLTDSGTILGLQGLFNSAVGGDSSITTVPFWQGALTNSFLGQITPSSDLMSYIYSLDNAGVKKMMERSASYLLFVVHC